MLAYILLFFATFYILFFAFVKIKYRFWAKQPVFHIYNMFYWIWPRGIIQHALPTINKYYDNTIITLPFNKLSAQKKELFYILIKSHYLNNKKEKYNPPKHAVLDYFHAHNKDSFISLLTKHNNIVSSMTCRPLNALLHSQKLSIGYIDFLCVHNHHRKTGLAQKIIYSQYYTLRHTTKQSVFLFKREGIINFIVPLTVYFAHVFPLKNFKYPNMDISNDFVCYLINDSNFALFIHFFGEIQNKFPCFIAPEISHIKHLVIKKLLFICLIMENNAPIGVYIFRTPFTTYQNKNSIECIASYYTKGYCDIFIKSFQNAIVLINQQFPIDILIIENMSHNMKLLRTLQKKLPTLWKCPMAYFLYNFAYRPFSSADVFIIN